MNWSVDFDKDIMKDKPRKARLKASPWLKKIKRAPWKQCDLTEDVVGRRCDKPRLIGKADSCWQLREALIGYCDGCKLAKPVKLYVVRTRTGENKILVK